jgi:hypothetical protein
MYARAPRVGKRIVDGPLLAPEHGPPHYLIESAGNPEWSHHVPLNGSTAPAIEEQTLTLPGPAEPAAPVIRPLLSTSPLAPQRYFGLPREPPSGPK